MADFQVFVDDVLLLLRQNTKYSSLLGVFFVATVLFHRYLPLIVVLWALLIGMGTFHVIFKRVNSLPNLLGTFERKRLPGVKMLSRRESSHGVCPVCGNDNCTRHRGELYHTNYQPWMDLYIPKRVDDALSEFFELVFRDFVYSWYSESISSDEEFVRELRTTLRYTVSVILRRLKQVDLPTVILDKLIKAALSHLDVYLRAKKKARWGQDMQELTLKQYGSHLHVAARNRHAELEYIRHLCELLFPFIVPNQPQTSRCTTSFLRELLSRSVIMPAMDVIANPDVVNKLLEIFFDKEPMAISNDPATEPVNILKAFSEARTVNANNALHYETSEILSNSTLLYPFLQFMRREGALNLLQFCLTVEDFNRRSLVPDMTDQQKRDLHLEAKELYNLYFDPHALDSINFDKEIVDAVRNIVTGHYEKIVEMRKTKSLFEAYEYVFSLLESMYCPMFHHSEEYFTLLCGKRAHSLAKVSNRSTPEPVPSPVNSTPPPLTVLQRVASKRSSDTFAAMSKLGSRIKEVFKGQSDGEGLSHLYLYEESSQPSSDVDIASDDDDHHRAGIASPQHDLSAWRVSIPSVQQKQEGGKESFVFVINIQRIDVREGDGEKNSWQVERRYHEFYALEQKLKEFHGGFEDAQLPVRRPFGSKSHDHMEKKRPVFEKYLSVLLTKPNLRGSQLLYSFLTTSEEFVNKFLGDVNIGKFVRSVSTKVIKERGQHLEPFLATFLASVESPKPKPRSDDEHQDPDQTVTEMLGSPLFENNASQELDRPSLKEPWPNPEAHYLQLSGILQYILYIARSVFEVPVWIHQAIVTFSKIFGKTLETYLDHYLNTKVNMVKSEQMLEHLIHLLRDVLFFDEDPPRTDAQKQERKDFAFQEMLKFFPGVVPKILGEEKFYDGCKLVFDALQYPKLNKQLSYTLLDIIIKEVFPELSDFESDGLEDYQEDHY
ncbi:sorting nexin-14-like [Diadema antillarum]|uniref:sorting nexin-14-like n=1 Tax=Diadema antillarum TaxID=105358 RepID=UPI003A8C09C0